MFVKKQSRLPKIDKDFVKTRLKNIALSGLRNYNAPQCAEEFKILKNLKNDNSIFVLKSDKGNGIVILNWDDYYSKMETILNYTSKFKLLEQDPIQMTFKRENKVRRFLSKLKADNVISDELYNKL